jgi:4Fe-4S iron-sulfur cluster binding domain/DR2241 stabilising domain
MNPDVRAFLAAFDTEIVFGQVVIRRVGNGFELRHVSDRAAALEKLANLKGTELRSWAQTATGGAFRPLKSAPNLRAGWLAVAPDGAALDLLLHYVYPGAVADWFAAQSPQPPVTSYRQFTARQTGMYRITTMLTDEIAGAAIRACCHTEFCLKRRLWSVEGLAPDATGQKSVIPCLEPCALMLEFARKVARLEQNTTPPSEEPVTDAAESNFDAPNNPRRARFSLEKRSLAIKPAID